MTDRSILEEATELTAGDRQRDYDHPRRNHERIVALWNAYLEGKGIPPTLVPEDVSRMMILVKIARDIATPKRDNNVDIAGYAWVTEEIRKEGAPSIYDI